MIWLLLLCGVLSAAVLALSVKVYTIKTAAREIRQSFSEKLQSDTNTLISISSNDKDLNRLAGDINVQLRQLREQRHRYIQGDSELKDAITNISHDLRTPLTVICGYLDLLEKQESSPEAQKYIEIIKNRADALTRLTEELFKYSVVTVTSEELNPQPLLLGSVLEECISSYYAPLKSRGIEPEITISETPVSRSLDKDALLRVFGNIIGNAVKYSGGDLKIVLKENGEIIFSNKAENLDPVQVGRLFDRFYTVESARNSTGLGLSIAKSLVQKMGGSIYASYLDGRLSIHVYFP